MIQKMKLFKVYIYIYEKLFSEKLYSKFSYEDVEIDKTMTRDGIAAKLREEDDRPEGILNATILCLRRAFFVRWS